MADGQRYTLISSDGHAGADLGGYKPYLASGFHDEFDAWAATFTRPWGEFDTELVDTDDEFIRIGRASFLSPYNWDSDKRLEHHERPGHRRPRCCSRTRCRPSTRPRSSSAWAPTTAEEYRLPLGRGARPTTAGWSTSAPRRRGGVPGWRRCSSATSTTRSPRCGGRRSRPEGRADPVRPHVPAGEPLRAPPRSVLGRVRRDRHAGAPARGGGGSAGDAGGPVRAAAAVGGHETYIFFSRGSGTSSSVGCSSGSPSCSSCSPRRRGVGGAAELQHARRRVPDGAHEGIVRRTRSTTARWRRCSLTPTEYFPATATSARR